MKNTRSCRPLLENFFSRYRRVYIVYSVAYPLWDFTAEIGTNKHWAERCGVRWSKDRSLSVSYQWISNAMGCCRSTADARVSERRGCSRETYGIFAVSVRSSDDDDEPAYLRKRGPRYQSPTISGWRSLNDDFPIRKYSLLLFFCQFVVCSHLFSLTKRLYNLKIF